MKNPNFPNPSFFNVYSNKRLDKLSEERITSALKGLGLSTIDTQVYVFLAKNGPCKIQKIVKELNLEIETLDRSLKDLNNIGVINFSIREPIKFAAIPFEELIDLFIEVKKEQAKTMKKNKEKVLSKWQNMLKKNSLT